MVQVTSKTSLGLCKVHLRTSKRSLGGLAAKEECAECQKMTIHEQKYHFFFEFRTGLKVEINAEIRILAGWEMDPGRSTALSLSLACRNFQLYARPGLS